MIPSTSNLSIRIDWSFHHITLDWLFFSIYDFIFIFSIDFLILYSCLSMLILFCVNTLVIIPLNSQSGVSSRTTSLKTLILRLADEKTSSLGFIVLLIFHTDLWITLLFFSGGICIALQKYVVIWFVCHFPLVRLVFRLLSFIHRYLLTGHYWQQHYI